MNIAARFDDLGPGGRSFVLCDPCGELVAGDEGDVAGVLRAAEAAARRGRWVAGFVTYEAARGLDPSLPALAWPAGHPLSTLPLAWFAAFARREEVEPPASAAGAEAPAPEPAAPAPGAEPAPGPWALDRDQAWHRRSVAQIQEAIAAGSYYQLNLTARLRGDVADPLGLYAALAAAQAGRYNALLTTPEHTVISASPELFFCREGDDVVARPMKGTAPRGRWPEEDREWAQRLVSSPKEQAENVMIVDLIRNDLGRVADVGSVHVPALFEAERYPTVWQLTSTVAARLRPGTDLGTLFAALFPSGSVTGTPKRAAMQAIARFERRPRGVYCGAVGYLRPGRDRPSARFSVAIRTVTRDNRTSYAEYGSGGAITACSEPESEWAELVAKTAVLHRPPRPARLIETLRFVPPGALVNLERHLARLAGSAAHFGFEYDRVAVGAALAAALEGRGEVARVRIGLEPSGRVRVETGPLVAAPAVARLGLADRPVRSDDVLLYHKHADRARYDRYREARPDLDDVVLWNERGEVTEATIANLAVRMGGRWWTPALGCGLLPGVERGRLLDAGVLAERTITLDELAAAESLALVSSLRGWRPATLVAPASASPRGRRSGRAAAL